MFISKFKHTKSGTRVPGSSHFTLRRLPQNFVQCGIVFTLLWNWYEWFHLVNHHFCIYWIILLSAFWSFFVKCTICFLTTMTAVSSAKVAIIICSSITRSLVYRRGIALISARFPVEFPSRSASTPRIVYHNAVVPLRVQGCHCGHSL